MTSWQVPPDFIRMKRNERLAVSLAYNSIAGVLLAVLYFVHPSFHRGGPRTVVDYVLAAAVFCAVTFAVFAVSPLLGPRVTLFSDEISFYTGRSRSVLRYVDVESCTIVKRSWGGRMLIWARFELKPGRRVITWNNNPMLEFGLPNNGVAAELTAVLKSQRVPVNVTHEAASNNSFNPAPR